MTYARLALPARRLSSIALAQCPRQPLSRAAIGNEISRTVRMALGLLWLIDGLLQLQPTLFSSYLSTGVIAPATQGQPGWIRAPMQTLVAVAGTHPAPLNACAALTELGLAVLLLCNLRPRQALFLSALWSVFIWAGGEGLGMLATGAAGAPTGAPGAALLYAVLSTLGLLPGDLARRLAVWVTGGYWMLAAILQDQPTWWRVGALTSAIRDNIGPGTLQEAVFGRALTAVAAAVQPHELLVNLALVAVAIGLAIQVWRRSSRSAVCVSLLVTAFFWIVGQGCGQVLTGTATDVGTGPVLAVITLMAWGGTGTNDLHTRVEGTVPNAE